MFNNFSVVLPSVAQTKVHLSNTILEQARHIVHYVLLFLLHHLVHLLAHLVYTSSEACAAHLVALMPLVLLQKRHTH